MAMKDLYNNNATIGTIGNNGADSVSAAIRNMTKIFRVTDLNILSYRKIYFFSKTSLFLFSFIVKILMKSLQNKPFCTIYT
jgi:hypothetical protein